MILLILLMVSFMVLIGVVIYRLVGRRPAGASVAGRDPGLDEVRVRYARGELSREDYLRLVEDLGGGEAGRSLAGPGQASPR